MADTIDDAETTAFVFLVASHKTSEPVAGLHGNNSNGQASTGSLSASPKRAPVSGAVVGATRYFVFEEVGE